MIVIPHAEHLEQERRSKRRQDKQRHDCNQAMLGEPLHGSTIISIDKVHSTMYAYIHRMMTCGH